MRGLRSQWRSRRQGWVELVRDHVFAWSPCSKVSTSSGGLTLKVSGLAMQCWGITEFAISMFCVAKVLRYCDKLSAYAITSPCCNREHRSWEPPLDVRVLLKPPWLTVCAAQCHRVVLSCCTNDADTICAPSHPTYVHIVGYTQWWE